MANKKITDFTALTSVADGDLLEIVDVSDTTDSGSGSSRKIARSDLVAGLVPTTTTVNGHALSANVTVTKSDVSLGNVTNDAQLKASDLDTDTTLAANSDTKIPSQKAVKAYVDASGGGGGSSSIMPALVRALTPSSADYSDTSSGGTVANNVNRVNLNSGSSANSYGAINWLWQDGDTPLWGLNSSMACHFETDFFNQANNFLGFVGTGFTNPRGDAFYTTDNSNHYGFFISRASGGNLVIKATCGNSSNAATQTTVYNSATTVLGLNLAAVHTVGVDVKFYLNGTLVATHTGNEPDPSTKGRPMHIVINNANTAANTRLIIYGYSFTRYMA